MGSDPITWYASDFYHVFDKGQLVGYVTSAWYSPTQQSNIALAMIPADLGDGNAARGRAAQEVQQHSDRASHCGKDPIQGPRQGNEGTGLKQTGSKL